MESNSGEIQPNEEELLQLALKGSSQAEKQLRELMFVPGIGPSGGNAVVYFMVQKGEDLFDYVTHLNEASLFRLLELAGDDADRRYIPLATSILNGPASWQLKFIAARILFDLTGDLEGYKSTLEALSTEIKRDTVQFYKQFASNPLYYSKLDAQSELEYVQCCVASGKEIETNFERRMRWRIQHENS